MPSTSERVADRVEAEQDLQATDDALKQWVLNRFGAKSTEAVEFGYSPRKNASVSAAARAKAVLLNQATREARGTMGKRQKADANPRVPVEDFVELRVVA